MMDGNNVGMVTGLVLAAVLVGVIASFGPVSQIQWGPDPGEKAMLIAWQR